MVISLSFLNFVTWISVCLGRNLHIGTYSVSAWVKLLAHQVSFRARRGFDLMLVSNWKLVLKKQTKQASLALRGSIAFAFQSK